MNRSVALAASGLTGFVSLSYEILWFRTFSFATGGTPMVFGILLFVYLTGIALGARFVRRAIPQGQMAGDERHLTRLGLILLTANILAFLVVPLQAATASIGQGILALQALGLAACGWGAAFPLLNQYGVNPDSQAGRGLSWLYLSNILGSVSGSLLTGFVLMEYFGLRTIAILLGGAGVSLSVWLLVLAQPSARHRALAVYAGGSITALFIGSAPVLFRDVYESLLLGRRPSADERFAEVIENRSGVIVVTHAKQVYGGGAYDGVISTDLVHNRNSIERVYAVAAIHPAPTDVLVIGLSTGAWAQVLVNTPGVERVTLIDINPGYLKIIPKYDEVASLLRNPKVEITIDDGRRWLNRNPARRFDAIVMNTTLHWRAHTTNLLSIEYLRLLRAHLKPGGIAYYNTTQSDDALKTALTNFPYGLRIVNFVAVSDSRIRWDSTRFRSVLESFAIDGRSVLDLTRSTDRFALEQLSTMHQLPATDNWSGIEWKESILARLPSARVVTDDNMVPEWKSAAVWRLVHFLRNRDRFSGSYPPSRGSGASERVDLKHSISSL